MGLKATGEKCMREKPRGTCRGSLLDSILDWEDSLPCDEMQLSETWCKSGARLCLCLGTSLQIMPVGNYPLLTKKNGGKVVVVNLQKTRVDKHADLVINADLDTVFRMMFERFFRVVSFQVPRPIHICLRLESDETDAKLVLDVSKIQL